MPITAPGTVFFIMFFLDLNGECGARNDRVMSDSLVARQFRRHLARKFVDRLASLLPAEPLGGDFEDSAHPRVIQVGEPEFERVCASGGG